VFTYKVDCWVKPHSGFDIATKNKSFDIIKRSSPEKNPLKNLLTNFLSDFEREGKNLVIKSFVLESDSIVTNIYKEILPEIQKKNPEASIISWSMLPVFVEKELVYA